MTKLYIQKESTQPVTEIVFESGTGDTIFLYEYETGTDVEIEIKSNAHGAIWISKDNIDLMIEALRKAEEYWG